MESEMDELPLAPEDEELVGADIQGDEQIQQQPAGQVVNVPPRDARIIVNGVEIFRNSSLATMRTACEFYSIAKSGGKQRVFQQLVDFQRNLELQAITGAAREAERQLERKPNEQSRPEMPSEKEQRAHALTRLPYAPWCDLCVSHRARANPHRLRDNSSRDGDAPMVSFDFCYTKAGEDGRQVRGATWKQFLCSGG